MKRKILSLLYAVPFLIFSITSVTYADELQDSSVKEVIENNVQSEDSGDNENVTSSENEIVVEEEKKDDISEPAEEATSDTVIDEKETAGDVNKTSEQNEDTAQNEQEDVVIEKEKDIETDDEDDDNVETTIEEHSENHCVISISYTKEVYSDPFARLETTELSLKSEYEILEGQTFDEFINSIENDDAKLILEKVEFDEQFTNGYNIEASIDIDGNVKVDSVKHTAAQEMITEVKVESVDLSKKDDSIADDSKNESIQDSESNKNESTSDENKTDKTSDESKSDGNIVIKQDEAVVEEPKTEGSEEE